jgi:hypothetical protein
LIGLGPRRERQADSNHLIERRLTQTPAKMRNPRQIDGELRSQHRRDFDQTDRGAGKRAAKLEHGL